MIDLKILREYPNRIKENLNNRFTKLDIDSLISLDNKVTTAKQENDKLKQQRNEVSDLIAKKKIEQSKKENLIIETRKIGEKIKELDNKIKDWEKERLTQAYYIPNFLNKETPIAKTEAGNKEVRQYGEIPNFNFLSKKHYELAEKLDILDISRGVKIAKSRFSLLKGKGALLERALAQFMLDIHLDENGYTEFSPPYLVNSDTIQNTGQLPKFEEDLFKTKKEDLYLIPTAEVSLTNIYKNEILDEQDLPYQLVAHTPCFRSEAGSYGKDTKGLIRQHQFSKVELVWLTAPEKSEEAHQKLVRHAEIILEKLELPYRTVILCSGDLGFTASKCYDIEVWLPGENTYREISSCSNCWDFQARRANIKFSPKKGGKPQFIHTLNGSGLAIGRTWLALIENYQQEDGSIKIPEILHPYTKGLTKIG